jgi:hypothetical protein
MLTVGCNAIVAHSHLEKSRLRSSVALLSRLMAFGNP